MMKYEIQHDNAFINLFYKRTIHLEIPKVTHWTTLEFDIIAVIPGQCVI